MRLYDLAEQYADLLDLMEYGEKVEGVEEMLEGLAGRIEDKAENVAKMIRSLEADSKQLAEEIARLQLRKKSIDASTNDLKRYLQGQLTKVKDRKLKSPMFTIWIQGNAPGLSIKDLSRIPDEYFKIVDPVPDNTRIIEAIKAGEEVPGAELKQTESIRIR